MNTNIPLGRKLLGWMIPEDPARGCGYGIFKLPLTHPFTRACDLHDYEFGESHAGEPNKTKDEVDWDLFYRWALIALAEKNIEKRIDLVWDIIKLWPLAREGGNLMWDGDPEPILETKNE